MDLVDRYIQAVKLWLPRAQKEDIAAELGEDIRSEIQEREGELGRKLQSAEVESLLRRRGRPIVAAGRFRKQESLIGPTLFPIYMTVLKAMGVPFVILTLVKWAIPFINSPDFLHGKAGGALLLHVASAFWSTAFFLFGGVTLVFAILERVQARTHFLDQWNPRDLMPIPERGRIERSSSITELAIQVAFFLWWVRPEALVRLESHGTTWSAGPTWEHLHHGFFVPVLIVSLATIGLSYANLVTPYWTRTRLLIRAATHWAAALIAAIVAIQGWTNFQVEWRFLQGAAKQVSGAAAATALTDLVIYQVVAWVAVGASIALVVDLVRAIRFRSTRDTELRPAPQFTEAFCL